MPRWYVSALLLGIVTVCAVCLGLRWRVIARSAPQDLAVPATAGGPLLSRGVGTVDQAGGVAAQGSGPDSATADPTPADSVPWGEIPAHAADAPASGAAPETASTPAAALVTADGPPALRASHPSKPPPQPVNINTATVAQLQALPGVGAVMAQRIVDYRSQHGAFKRVEQLQEVKGIGPKKFAKLAPWAHV